MKTDPPAPELLQRIDASPQTRRGANADAFAGGFRLWERQDLRPAAPSAVDWTIAAECEWPGHATQRM